MKILFQFVTLTLSVFLSCSSSKTEVAQADTTGVNNQAIPKESPNAFQHEQKLLDAFMAEFYDLEKTEPKIVYRQSFDLGGSTLSFHFVNDSLRYFFSNISEEGGYYESMLVKIVRDNEIVVRWGSESNGFLKWVKDGQPEWYKTGINMRDYNLAKVEGAGEPVEYNYRRSATLLFMKILSNKAKFKLVNNIYEWYPMIKKITGHYGGQIEVNKQILIDPRIMDLNLMPFYTSGSDMLDGFVNVWYPLYESPEGGFERHKNCGVERTIEIKQDNGQHVWRAQGLQDILESLIISFDIAEGESFKAQLESDSNGSAQFMIYDDNSGLLYINGYPYTSDPNPFVIKEKCQ